MDQNSDGVLSYDEFFDLMTRKIGSKSVDEEMEELFDLFDIDSTNQITYKNIKDVCKEVGMQFTEDDIQVMMARADLDEKGFASRDDFKRIMRRGETSLAYKQA